VKTNALDGSGIFEGDGVGGGIPVCCVVAARGDVSEGVAGRGATGGGRCGSLSHFVAFPNRVVRIKLDGVHKSSRTTVLSRVSPVHMSLALPCWRRGAIPTVERRRNGLKERKDAGLIEAGGLHDA
jgi:hypothetical protein